MDENARNCLLATADAMGECGETFLRRVLLELASTGPYKRAPMAMRNIDSRRNDRGGIEVRGSVQFSIHLDAVVEVTAKELAAARAASPFDPIRMDSLIMDAERRVWESLDMPGTPPTLRKQSVEEVRGIAGTTRAFGDVDLGYTVTRCAKCNGTVQVDGICGYCGTRHK